MSKEVETDLEQVSLDDLTSIDLSQEEKIKLASKHTFSDYKREKLDKDAKKNWDLFYKRNGDRFFKNRYWIKREFKELFTFSDGAGYEELKYLLEIGCGCGDFILPLLENTASGAVDKEGCDNHSNKNSNRLFIYCCDVSDQAINILNSKLPTKGYTGDRVKAFVADITKVSEESRSHSGRFTKYPVSVCESHLDGNKMDFVSLIFVLSALDPNKMKLAVENIYSLTKPGALILFRDYAIYDKAMLRFHEDSKICDQFYVRQDGTRAYFFSKSQLLTLFEKFHCQSINYVKTETVNKASGDHFSRIFLQAKFLRQ